MAPGYSMRQAHARRIPSARKFAYFLSLTIYRGAANMDPVEYLGNAYAKRKNRPAARNIGHAHLEVASTRPDARIRHFGADPPDVRRRSTSRTRVALSRA